MRYPVSLAASNLQNQATDVAGSIATLNANYTISCLTWCYNFFWYSEILQAVIKKLITSSQLSALALDVSTELLSLLPTFFIHSRSCTI